MSVVAQLQFTQNLTTAAAGRAMIGVAGLPVTVASVLNTNVVRYVFILLDVPIGSALVAGTVLSDGPTANTTFTPDIDGGFRIGLIVYDADDFTSQQVKNFYVPNSIAAFTATFASRDDESDYEISPGVFNHRGWTQVQETEFRALVASIGAAGVASLEADGGGVLTGAVTMSSGSGVSMTTLGNDIQISSTAPSPEAATPLAVAATGAVGTSADYSRGDHVHQGVTSVEADGGGALSGVLTLTPGAGVAMTTLGNDVTISATGGRMASVTWDAAQATNAPAGRYATMAEIITQIGSLESPIEVLVKGAASADVVGTYEWENVHFVTDEPGASLIGEEGVIVRNVRISGPLAVGTNATTTNFIEYTAGKAALFDGPILTGNVNKGLFTANHAGALQIIAKDTEFGSYSYEQTQNSAVAFKMANSKFVGTQQLRPTTPLITGSISFESDTSSQLDSLDISQWQGGLVSYSSPATAAGDLESDITLPTVGRVRGALLADSGMAIPVGAVLTAELPDLRHAPIVTTGGAFLLPRRGSADIVRWEVDAALHTSPNRITRLNVDVSAPPAALTTICDDGVNLWYAWYDGVSAYELRRVNPLIERSDFSVVLTGFNDAPGEMVWHSGSSSFWIIDTDGTQVVKVEIPNPLGPPTITVVPLGSTFISGILANGPYVYVTADAGQVFQIVAATAVPTGFAIGGGAEVMYPGALGGAGFLWVGGDSETVYRLNATTMAVSGSFTTADTGLKRVCYQPVGVGPEALYVLNSNVGGTSIRRILTPQGAMSAGANRVIPTNPTPPEVMVLSVPLGRLVVPLTDDRYGKLFVSRTDTTGDPVAEPSLEPSFVAGYPAGGRTAWAMPAKPYSFDPTIPYVTVGPFVCDDAFLDAKAPPIKVLKVNTLIGLAAINVTLPFQGVANGDTIVIKDDGDASVFPIVIADSFGTIDGQPNYTINTTRGAVTLSCDNGPGHNWTVVAKA